MESSPWRVFMFFSQLDSKMLRMNEEERTIQTRKIEPNGRLFERDLSWFSVIWKMAPFELAGLG
jgi:hypothetical protein